MDVVIKPFLAVLLLSLCNLTFAQGVTIEEMAALVTKKHNEAARYFTDDMTVSSTAEAVGRNIRFTNILRVQKGLPKAKRDEFQMAVYSKVVPEVCAVNADNVAIDRGLYYTFLYFNTYGEKLAEFIVNARACHRN